MARPRRPVGGRAEARLDPVRWRRPGRGTLLRLAAITVFLATAALISWSGPETCASTSATTSAGGRPANSRAGSAGSTQTSATGIAEGDGNGQDKDNGQVEGNGQSKDNGRDEGAGQSPYNSQSRDDGQGVSNADGQGGSKADRQSGSRDEGNAGPEGKYQAGPGPAGVPTGRVGVPIRLAEPAALTLVHPGDHVDLLRITDDNRGTSPVASAALVLGVTGADDPTTGGLLVALTPAEAAAVVSGSERGFAVLIRP